MLTTPAKPLIFISYSHRDSRWLEFVQGHLEVGVTNDHFETWDDRRIKGGADWAKDIDDALWKCSAFILLVSRHSLVSAFILKQEVKAALDAHWERGVKIYPIIIAPCDVQAVPWLTKMNIRPRDAKALSRYSSAKRDEVMASLAAEIRDIIKSASTIVERRTSKTGLSNIPIRVPLHFMGRDDALTAIEAALKRHEGRVAITTLHGLRGVGKTTLAAAYAVRHRGEYRATWWIRAQATSTMRADLVALGIQLGWVGLDDKEETAVDIVMKRLRDEGEGILLIFDNAVDANALEDYLPQSGGAKVLVTSNAPTWRGIAEPVEIEVWPKKIGADYLIARTGRMVDRVAAESLSQQLGGLPLAHVQAGAYCERLGISLAEYRRRFEAAPVWLLDDTRDAPAAYHNRLTVAKTFAVAIEEAAKLHPAAEPLIVYAAMLAPEPIPLFLFAEARENLGEPLATALAGDGLDEAVAALRTFALIDRESITDQRDLSITNDTIRLHRLVREIAAARHDEVREGMRLAVIPALTQVYPGDAYSNPASWPRCALLTPHVLASCETEKADLAEKVEWDLLTRAAGYFFTHANYSEGRPLVERALAISEKVLGPEHPDTAQSLNNLALLLQAQGDLAAARPIHERALAISEKVLGPEHPDTATSLNNLAGLLQGQGDLAAGRRLLERALAIRKKVLGPEHPHTATSLNNLARVLQDQGDLAAGRRLYERALAIREKVLGPEHPDTATSLNNLARVLQDQGDLSAARPLLERALAIREKVLGPEHPDTAASLDYLALNQGDLSAARPRLERALAIYEKVLGPEHPHTATGLNNLALLLQAQGDLSAARPLLERALAICEKGLGPEHPHTATSLNSLARVLQAQGDLSAARPLLERALAIYEKGLGPEHPETAESREKLARLIKDLGGNSLT
jgi:tetratricopeptide (TPR) repeat protein